LTGTRLVQLDPDDARYIPVMTPGEIAALPAGHALLLRNTLRPVIGRAPMAWERRPHPATTAWRSTARVTASARARLNGRQGESQRPSGTRPVIDLTDDASRPLPASQRSEHSDAAERGGNE
jgi:hypothetical protein